VTPTPPADPTTARPLTELLADYLVTAAACRWPGGDGFLVSDVVREYPAAVAARQVPGELDLCDLHPELAAQVVAFFFLLTVADTLHD
jgi:hypothetical protein